jgi:hypothetical protein
MHLDTSYCRFEETCIFDHTVNDSLRLLDTLFIAFFMISSLMRLLEWIYLQPHLSRERMATLHTRYLCADHHSTDSLPTNLKLTPPYLSRRPPHSYLKPTPPCSTQCSHPRQATEPNRLMRMPSACECLLPLLSNSRMFDVPRMSSISGLQAQRLVDLACNPLTPNSRLQETKLASLAK